ncbi:MAG: class I SAM-dependent methyltransferase, partial [Gammaproteobacteria bacterium]|nr:class I SAM-dependent methyltransferase [Gammaproteobacteria bacterium]
MGELKEKASRYADSFDGAAALGDSGSRSLKAAKIRAVLEADGVKFGADLRILDIGCAHGLILRSITPEGAFGVGIDMDESLGCKAKNLVFLRTDAERLPFRSDSFDVVICNHVYEHTDDASRLVAEIARVLTPDGRCYFAGPNKYDLVEPHYRLPLLSWFPRKIADAYMRLAGKGSGYPEKPYSPGRLRKLVAGFDVRIYT